MDDAKLPAAAPHGKWNTAELASDPRVGFLMALGRALHAAGHSSQGLEETLDLAASRLGVPGEFLTTPTSLIAAFGHEDRQRINLVRIRPESANLSRLAAINDILAPVLEGTLDAREGAERLRAVTAAPSPYSTRLTTIGYGLSSASAAVFFGGGPREVAIASLLGLVTGLLAILAGRLETLQRVFPAAASFLVAFLATAIGTRLGPVSVSTLVLAGLVVLLPGLMLVSAMGELSTGHLAAGTARAAGAFITFIGIGFGVALGSRIGELAFGVPRAVTTGELPAWAIWVALVGSALAFSVLLRADRRDVPWIIAAAFAAILASDAGSRLVGAELGPFFGSFAVAVAGWVFLHRTGRPATVVVAPGVLVLVPGSIGFRSVAALLENQTVAGIETAFRAVLTAIALVVGLLIANVVLPSRRDSPA